MAINLDQYDTKIPVGLLKIALRGEEFQIRKQTVAEMFDTDPRYTSEDEFKRQLCHRLFEVQMDRSGAPKKDDDGFYIPTTAGKKEFDRWYKHMTKPDAEAGKSGLGYNELVKLAAVMIDVAKGNIDDEGNPIPKGSGSRLS